MNIHNSKSLSILVRSIDRDDDDVVDYITKKYVDKEVNVKKQEWRQQVQRMTAATGEIIEVNGEGVVTVERNGETFKFRDNMTVEALKSFRVGGEVGLPNSNVQLTISAIEQSFSDDFSDNLGLVEKKKKINNDKDVGQLLSIVPSTLAMISEMATTVNRISENPLEMTAFAQNLPFPVLYELFQNAPEEVRLLLAPMIIGMGGVFVGGRLAGKGVNKLRYVARNLQLRHEFGKEEKIDIADVITSFKGYSKTRTSEQAYLDTQEEYSQL